MNAKDINHKGHEGTQRKKSCLLRLWHFARGCVLEINAAEGGCVPVDLLRSTEQFIRIIL
jgi:hypothetical protein